jgi:AraC-like DNA-binding protein
VPRAAPRAVDLAKLARVALPSLLASATQRFRPLLVALREADIDPAVMLSALGVSESMLLDPATRVPRERTVLLTKRLLELAPSPQLALRAASLSELRDLGVVGYLARHSDNALQAIERLVRYARLIADAAHFALEVRDGEVHFIASLLGERAFMPLGVDFSTATVVRTIELLSGGRARPLSVDLPRPKPRELAPYRTTFGPVIRFDSERVVLRYAEAPLRAPCPDADPQLAAILEEHAARVLSAMPPPTTLYEQARALIGREIERGDVRANSVAETLRISERSLRRKLRDAGSSYRALLDEVRCERALALLDQQKLPVGEVAQRLGFSDATAFTRSFRRWTGRAPSEHVRDAR